MQRPDRHHRPANYQLILITWFSLFQTHCNKFVLACLHWDVCGLSLSIYIHFLSLSRLTTYKSLVLSFPSNIKLLLCYRTVDYNSRGGWDILLVEVVLKLCDCFSSRMGLLQKKRLILWTELNICRLLQQEICSYRTFFDSCKELLKANKNKNVYTVWASKGHLKYVYMHTHTLVRSSSALKLSRLLKMSSFGSSLLVLLIKPQMASLSASKCSQELRVTLKR